MYQIPRWTWPYMNHTTVASSQMTMAQYEPHEVWSSQRTMTLNEHKVSSQMSMILYESHKYHLPRWWCVNQAMHHHLPRCMGHYLHHRVHPYLLIWLGHCLNHMESIFILSEDWDPLCESHRVSSSSQMTDPIWITWRVFSFYERTGTLYELHRVSSSSQMTDPIWITWRVFSFYQRTGTLSVNHTEYRHLPRWLTLSESHGEYFHFIRGLEPSMNHTVYHHLPKWLGPCLNHRYSSSLPRNVAFSEPVYTDVVTTYEHRHHCSDCKPDAVLFWEWTP